MKNSKLRRVLLLLASAVLLVSLSVGATLAYLTSESEQVQNTFTVGDVNIVLYETDIDKGTSLDTDNSDVWTYNNAYDRNNKYKLLPNQTYKKDPTVFMQGLSEESYLRMKVTVTNYKNLVAAFPAEYTVGGIFLLQNVVKWNTDWAYYGFVLSADGNTATYEFRYNKTVNALDTAENAYKEIPALFTTITIPPVLDNDDIELLNNTQINVIAHAIQSAGFVADTANNLTAEQVAWNAFDAQMAAN